MARLVPRRPLTWFLLSVGLVGVALVLGLGGVGGSAEPTGRIVVARIAIPPGTLIDVDRAPDLVTTAAVPAGLGLVGLLDDPSAAVGRRTVAPVAPGEPVTEGVLGGAPGTGPDPLAPGERAVSLPLAAAGGAAAAVTPGASVDVVASTGDGPSGRTRIVVAGAEVLAVADAPSPDGVVPDGAGVLVRVSAGQALRITAALNFAREVRLLVRPVDEVGGAVPSAAEAPAP